MHATLKHPRQSNEANRMSFLPSMGIPAGQGNTSSIEQPADSSSSNRGLIGNLFLASRFWHLHTAGTEQASPFAHAGISPQAPRLRDPFRNAARAAGHP
jgi:hypothetical protein